MPFIKEFFDVDPDSTNRRMSPFAAAIPFSLGLVICIIAGLELIHLPSTMLTENPTYWWKVPILALDGAIYHFRFQIVCLLHMAAMLTLFEQRRRLLLLLGSLWSIGITLYTYFVLTSYVRFQGYWPFIALFIAAALFLSLSFVGLMLPKRFADSSILTRIFWYGHPAAFLLLAVGMHLVNFIVFDNVYPTLHLSLGQFTVVVFTMGGALALVRFPLGPLRKSSVQWIVVTVIAHLFFFATHLAKDDGIRQANPLYERYSLLGQANMVNRDIQTDSDVEAIDVSSGNFNFSDFNKMSGMPALPPHLNLRDYNILLVTVESLRYDQTSLYKPAWKNTPTLEKMRKEGAFSFKMAISPSMKTMVSISSLMAMTYASFAELSLKRNPAFGKLRDSEVTVAELLRDSGYQTFRVSHNFANVFSRLNLGFDQGFDRNKLLCTNPKLGTCDRDITNAAIAEINLALKQQKPFFGWIFLSAPHAYYLPHYDDMPADTEIERFRQEIRYSDEHLARLLAHLKKTKLDKTTIVIVMGDHGEEFKEHGRTQHNSIYMECVHVAFVVKIPGVTGKSVSTPISTTYLFPWLFQNGTRPMKAAAFKRVRDDFGPMMKSLDGAIISELFGTKRSNVALLLGDYRMHFDYASNYYEMFNLKTDSEEKRNIYRQNDPQSQKLKGLIKKYKGIRKAKAKVTFD